jgi:hypothetical protein
LQISQAGTLNVPAHLVKSPDHEQSQYVQALAGLPVNISAREWVSIKGVYRVRSVDSKTPLMFP